MSHLRKEDYYVADVPLSVAQSLVERYHYAKGGSNTRTYTHGLFRDDDHSGCLGVAWWIPPTKGAAQATFHDWTKVLCLSRLVVHPSVPTNGASFLLSRSMKLIDRERWPCLVTYADEWRGHTGMIYKATNWKYCGLTKPEAVWTLNGRMVARKAGPHTRTKQEMLDLGAVMEGRFAKHKYRHLTK